MVAAPLTVHAERDYHNYLCEDNTESDVEEVQAVGQRFWSEEANVDDLEEQDDKDREWNYFLLDLANTMEFLVIHEAKIVLVHIVFHAEEAECKEANIWHYDRKDHWDGEGCEAVGHMVSQVISICIHKRLLNFFISLLCFVAAFHDWSNHQMWDVK